MTLRCGVASRDITPAYPAYLHGYSARNHLSTGVAEPLRAMCLALDDGTTQLLILSFDMIGIEASACQALYRLIEARTGVSYPRILVTSSHTHFAPALHPFSSADPEVGIQEPDPRFVADVHAKVAEMAVESLRNLEPVTLEYTRTRVPQVLFNRRTVKPDGTVVTHFRYPADAEKYTFGRTDPELTILRWRGETGLNAVLTNFGCHPVTGGRVQPPPLRKPTAKLLSFTKCRCCVATIIRRGKYIVIYRTSFHPS